MDTLKEWCRVWRRGQKARVNRRTARDPHAGYWFPTKKTGVAVKPDETYAAAYVREWTARNHLK